MESVTIDGVEYVKASVLAKRLRYTADYIGQLCRSKKVDAHLVGRTWYVYPPSLEGHKSTRYAELRSSEKNAQEPSKTTSSRIDVVPPVSKKTLRAQSPHFHNRVFWKSPSYEEDSAELLPGVQKTAVREKMPIKLADSEELRVVSKSRNVTLVSQPLPAVSLSGTLKVLDFEPEFEVAEEEVEEVNKSVENTNHVGEIVEEIQQPAPTVVRPVVKSITYDEAKETPAQTPAKSAFEARLAAMAKQPAAVSETPKAAGTPVSTKTAQSPAVVPHLTVPKSPEKAPQRTSVVFQLVVAPVAVLMILAAAAMVLTVESVTTVATGGSNDASLRLNASLIESFFERF